MSKMLRSAEPEDAQFLSRIILQAGRSHSGLGLWDIAIDGSDEVRLDFLEQLILTREAHFCHFSHFHIVDDNGLPASAMAAYDPNSVDEQTRVSAIAEAALYCGWETARIKSFFAAAEVWSAGLPPIDERGLLIDWVATLPEYQRRGHAKQLLLAKVQQAQVTGYSRIFLHVQQGNRAATQLYDQIGFRVVKQASDSPFEARVGCPGLALMELAL